MDRIKIDGDRWTAQISFAPVAFDPDYWLSRSEGFLVDSPEGGVGVVDEIARTPDGEIDFLAVAGGWFGRREYRIALSDVEEIRPGPQRILVGVAVHAERPAAAGASRSTCSRDKQKRLLIGTRTWRADTDMSSSTQETTPSKCSAVEDRR